MCKHCLLDVSIFDAQKQKSNEMNELDGNSVFRAGLRRAYQTKRISCFINLQLISAKWEPEPKPRRRDDDSMEPSLNQILSSLSHASCITNNFLIKHTRKLDRI